MGLVPRLNAFAGLDRHQFADGPGIEDFFDLAIKRGKPQDEAHHDPPAAGRGEPLDLQHLFDAGGDGLFQQHVVADLECPAAVREVVVVLRGDDQHVGQPARPQQFFAAGEAAEVVAAGQSGDLGHALRHRIGPGHDLELLRPSRGQFAIRLRPCPAAEARDSQRFFG